jgi:hypothetical protein
MYKYHGIVYHGFKAVLHTMIAGFAACNYSKVYTIWKCLQYHLRIAELVFGEYQYDMYVFESLYESIDRIIEDGLAQQGQELFGNCTVHPEAFASCYYDCIFFQYRWFEGNKDSRPCGYTK